MHQNDPLDMTIVTIGHDVLTPIKPLRVAIQRWGFSAEEVQGVIMDCPTFAGALEWIQAEHAGARADVVVHLVDAARLTGANGGAMWNAMGPVQAMRKARNTGSLEIALVLGAASQLPAVRAGSWILAGSRSLASALGILLRSTLDPAALLAEGSEPLRWLRELASLDATCLLLQQTDPAPERLAGKIEEDLVALIGGGYAAPSWISIAGPSAAIAALRQRTGVIARRLRYAARPFEKASADLVVAFPWPDLVR